MSGPKDLEHLETGQNCPFHRLQGLRNLLVGLEDRNPADLHYGLLIERPVLSRHWYLNRDASPSGCQLEQSEATAGPATTPAALKKNM